ncbi:MAG: hypothetical protein Kow0049_15330 [Stanieria sp.]
MLFVDGVDLNKLYYLIINLRSLFYLDTVIIIGITIVAVGGVKLGYALMVDQARLLVNSKTRKIINIVFFRSRKPYLSGF